MANPDVVEARRAGFAAGLFTVAAVSIGLMIFYELISTKAPGTALNFAACAFGVCCFAIAAACAGITLSGGATE